MTEKDLNAIINDNSNDDDLMIEERIDKLIKTYEKYIAANNRIINERKGLLIVKLTRGNCEYIKRNAETIEQYMKENVLFETFIESLEYAKTGERK